MKRNENWHLLSLLIAAFFLVGCFSSQATADRPPNILFILADDLGWSDTTLYGTTNFYRTPNIQRLARRGMTFTRAYSASPLCSPTRASILTGMAPARHGITAPQCHLPAVRLKVGMKDEAAANAKCIQPDSITRLDPATTTIAETLKQLGYVTGHFGKWHLGREPYSPLEHGFDVDVPHWPGPGPAGSYVAPWKFDGFDHDPDIPDEHIEDRMAKEAITFIRENRDKPFFLNYWMFSVHAPFDAKKELINQYKKVVDPTDQQRCPTYAAMIESMDDAVGTLLDELDRLKLAENTIIVFASDNGGNAYSLVDGQRPTNNRPLRGGKATMYEGGVRTPAVVVWPAIVEAGSMSDEFVQSMDFYPTLMDLIDASVPPNQVIDGISLVPALKGESLARDELFTYFPHNPPVPDWMPPAISVHSGDWKLIRLFHSGENGSHRYKLFDLANDIGERIDLSEKDPERVRELDRLIDHHLQDTNAVVPVPNPKFDPARYDATKEGEPAPKFIIGATQKPKRKRPSKPVAGWRASGTCELSLADNGLRVESHGGDPYISCQLDEPISAGELTLSVRMRSSSAGYGQVFWKPAGKPFGAKRSKQFEPLHDGSVQTHAIEFKPETPIVAIRIDPSRDVGTIDVIEVRLLRDSKVLRSWSF